MVDNDDCWVDADNVVEEAWVGSTVMSVPDDCWVEVERVVEVAWVGSSGR